MIEPDPEFGLEVTTSDSGPQLPNFGSSGAFNVNSFMTDIRSRGIVRSHSFMINIIPPKIMRDLWPDTRSIIIRCDSASLPTVNFQMNEIFRHGYGPQETSPHNVQFEPINLTFIVDGWGEVYKFWYTWMNRIMNFNRSRGLNIGDELGRMPYEMSYKDDYSTEMRVLVYNEYTDNIIQATMLRAFPMGISDVTLNWSSTDDIVRLNVPISYKDFYAEVEGGHSSQGVFDFLSNTINGNSLNIRSVLDQLNIFGFKNNYGPTTKLDRIISDILLK